MDDLKILEGFKIYLTNTSRSFSLWLLAFANLVGRGVSPLFVDIYGIV